jgi:hypothetical protein
VLSVLALGLALMPRGWVVEFVCRFNSGGCPKRLRGTFPGWEPIATSYMARKKRSGAPSGAVRGPQGLRGLAKVRSQLEENHLGLLLDDMCRRLALPPGIMMPGIAGPFRNGHAEGHRARLGVRMPASVRGLAP